MDKEQIEERSHINPPFPSLEEFLGSTGYRMVDSRKRLWHHPSYGRIDEEQAIELAYKHWTIAGF